MHGWFIFSNKQKMSTMILVFGWIGTKFFVIILYSDNDGCGGNEDDDDDGCDVGLPRLFRRLTIKQIIM